MSSKTTTPSEILLDISISNKKNKKNKNHSKQRKNIENKENISLNIIKEVDEEESSAKNLKSKQNEKKEKEESKQRKNDMISLPVKQDKLYKNEYEKYKRIMKEKAMKMEIDRIYNETERLNQEYEEKRTNLHLFINNPQFKKVIDAVKVKLLFFLLIEIIFIAYSVVIYLKLVEDNNGIGLASLCLSITLIAMTIILMAFLKIGILNDPHLSKAFRFFVVIQFLVLISSFCISIFSGFAFIYNMENIYIIDYTMNYKIILYLLFLIVLVAFIARVTIGFNLFFESVLILIGKKTEYSVLILREEKSNKDNNYSNLSTSISNDGLNKSNLNLVNENNGRKKLNEEDINYMAYNYFNKFHYSVSSDRKGEYIFNQSQNITFI
jgi:hypothetical protein